MSQLKDRVTVIDTAWRDVKLQILAAVVDYEVQLKAKEPTSTPGLK